MTGVFGFRRISRAISSLSWEHSFVSNHSFVENTYQLAPTPGKEFNTTEAKAIIAKVSDGISKVLHLQMLVAVTMVVVVVGAVLQN